MTRFSLLAAALALGLAAPALSDETRAGPAQPSAAWTELASSIFPGRAIADAADMIAIDAPYRAHEAGAVPVEISIRPPLGRTVARFSLVIDENPAPVAAEVEVGPGMGRTVAFSTLVRVDAYSNLRVVAELDDGSLVQSGVFVKASGGCSAPANKSEAVADIGRMKLRGFPAEGGVAEAQLLIRHPNHSGFQLDQVSLLAIPAWFVDTVEVRQGQELVMRLTGGISLSENPSIRFGYVPNGAPVLAVRVEDTSGGEWADSFPVAGS